MTNMLKISEAASLALHTAVFLSRNPNKRVSTKDIAKAFDVSEAHLSKVLQRLGKSGIVKAIRGPRGGFTLAKPSKEISLLEVYESIEGKLILSNCLFGTQNCEDMCIMGDLVRNLNNQVNKFLTETKLSDFAK